MKRFLQEVTDHYANLTNVRAKEKPPQEQTELYSKRDEDISQFYQHIEEEKSKVATFIETLRQQFQQLCDKLREKMLKELELEAETYRLEFHRFKTTFDSFYGDAPSTAPTKDELTRSLNSLTNQKEFESKINEYLTEMSQAQESKTLNVSERIQLASETLTGQAAILKAGLKYKPSISVATPTIKDALVNITEETMDNLLISGVFRDPNYVVDSGHFESKILKNPQTKGLLSKWIGKGMVKLSLLYRGSRDGFNSNAFHSKVQLKKPTISIIKTKTDHIFGGYSDVAFNKNLNSPQKSDKCFLFSINLKEKFALKPNMEGSAIYGGGDYYIMDFGQNDFYIPNDCDKNSSGMADFNLAYDAKGKTTEQIAGGKSFSVVEIETYEVLGKKF
jgi:hypothetical protein